MSLQKNIPPCTIYVNLDAVIINTKFLLTLFLSTYGITNPAIVLARMAFLRACASFCSKLNFFLLLQKCHILCSAIHGYLKSNNINIETLSWKMNRRSCFVLEILLKVNSIYKHILFRRITVARNIHKDYFITFVLKWKLVMLKMVVTHSTGFIYNFQNLESILSIEMLAHIAKGSIGQWKGKAVHHLVLTYSALIFVGLPPSVAQEWPPVPPVTGVLPCNSSMNHLINVYMGSMSCMSHALHLIVCIHKILLESKGYLGVNFPKDASRFLTSASYIIFEIVVLSTLNNLGNKWDGFYALDHLVYTFGRQLCSWNPVFSYTRTN